MLTACVFRRTLHFYLNELHVVLCHLSGPPPLHWFDVWWSTLVQTILAPSFSLWPLYCFGAATSCSLPRVLAFSGMLLGIRRRR